MHRINLQTIYLLFSHISVVTIYTFSYDKQYFTLLLSRCPSSIPVSRISQSQTQTLTETVLGYVSKELTRPFFDHSSI